MRKFISSMFVTVLIVVYASLGLSATTHSFIRKRFGDDPRQWAEFKKKYARELKAHANLLEMLKEEARHGTITLLYAAKDIEHNNAVALREILGN